MNNKVSVITVVFNDVSHIRETMDSFFSQTWEEKEYIVIDGGSTDGTAEIIREYKEHLAFWCSERDNGIYDAMNKGIHHANGDWIIVLNSGDTFAFDNSLEKAILNTPDIGNADVIYGDSIERGKNTGDVFCPSSNDVSIMNKEPIYRHGSSLVRRDVQNAHLYQVTESDKYGFALDWLMIHRLFKEGYRFQKTDAIIERFLTEGVSNNPKKSRLYNKMICNGGNVSSFEKLLLNFHSLINSVKNTAMYRWLVAFLLEYVVNDILPHIPFWTIRKFVLKSLKLSIGNGTFIMKDTYFMSLPKICIGENSHINRQCMLDGRGSVKIGNSVSVSFGAKILSGGHSYQSKNFRGQFLPIKIADYVWIGANATILQNVTIGEGAVVCAGAVVTKDVEPYTVVGGVPAKVIGSRNKDLDYKCKGYQPFT